MASLKERLIEILIGNKLISQDQFNRAVEIQKTKGGKLSDIIVSLKYVSEADLISTLSESLGLPLIDLKRFKIDPQVAKIIPSEIARHYQIIPVSKMGDSISVAMADPLNIFAIDHVGSLTKHKIVPIIASSQDINQAIEQSYPDSTKDVIDDLVQDMSATSIELIREDKESVSSQQELDMGGRQGPVIKLTNMILEEGVKKKSSDILIEPFDKKLRIRYRVDGVLQEQSAPPKNMHQYIVSRIKVMSDLDIAEHRLPQDGRFKVKMLDREVDFRVSVLPTSFGEKVALRVLDKSEVTLDIDKLGFSPDEVASLKKVSKMPHGMLLVCGPTGSGKTTTLYSLLKFVDSPQKNIITVEDPVEYQLEGINQVTVRQEIGLTFASSLRSILRQDPNIIMIGEIRDYETVDIAIKSALTGHLVISTLHTNTAAGAIVRLTNMGVDPYLINASLICALSQRLVRRICVHCRQEYAADKEMLDSLRLSQEFIAGRKMQFFRGRGCSRCFNIGYSGRTSIAEILVLSSEIREMILHRAQENLIKQQARKEGMKTLRESGVESALKGMTSLEEVLRVTASDE